jgi:RimJ/RimL family protein N-acetyltransferase
MTFKEKPIGASVDTAPARAPQRISLVGRTVRLEPLKSAHAAALFDVCAQPEDADLWTYMYDGPFDSRETFAANIARKIESADPLFFALIDPATGLAAGHASLIRIDTTNRVIEVGNIMIGRTIQRTAASTEAIYLLAKHVFDELGYRRFEWKCNDLNAPSRRAASRLGFAFEGVFRQHLIVKGRNRDTAWYSMLDSEWPARKMAFETWLAPDNFDARGRQIVSLGAIGGVGSV